MNMIKYSLSENSNYKNHNEIFNKHNNLASYTFQEIVMDYYWFVISITDSIKVYKTKLFHLTNYTEPQNIVEEKSMNN